MTALLAEDTTSNSSVIAVLTYEDYVGTPDKAIESSQPLLIDNDHGSTPSSLTTGNLLHANTFEVSQQVEPLPTVDSSSPHQGLTNGPQRTSLCWSPDQDNQFPAPFRVASIGDGRYSSPTCFYPRVRCNWKENYVLS